MRKYSVCQELLYIKYLFMRKSIKKHKKSLDNSSFVCYNIEVAWRDGRVGLRRTTGNRVYPNRYHGFESHSLRQQKTHFCLPTKVRFLNDVCLRQMMLASPMMTATPNDVCLTAHWGKHPIIAERSGATSYLRSKCIISP